MIITDTNRSTISQLSLILVAVLWGAGFVASKIAVEAMSPVYVLLLRFLGDGILLLLFFRKRILNVSRNVMLHGVEMGIAGFVSLLLQLVALQYTTPGKQAFLATTYVVFVPVVLWIVKKIRPEAKTVPAVLLAVTGAALLSLQNGFSSFNTGDLMSIGCAVAASVQLIIANKYVKSEDPVALSFYQCFAEAVPALIISCFVYAFDRTGIKTPTVSFLTVGAIIYIIIFNTFIAFTLQNVAQRYTTPEFTSISLSLESVFGSVFSLLFFRESFTVRGILGCSFIFIAVIITRINIPGICSVFRQNRIARNS